LSGWPGGDREGEDVVVGVGLSPGVTARSRCAQHSAPCGQPCGGRL